MTHLKHTFLNQPLEPNRLQVNGYAAIVGIGLNSSYESHGVDQAPDHLRLISNRYSNSDGSAQPLKIYNPDRGYILHGVTITDTGNIDLGNHKNFDEIIAREIKKIIQTKAFPIILGGDHYITFPVLLGYSSDIKVIHIDAHGDFLSEDSCCPHGYVMNKVSTLEHVKQIIHVGLRGNLNTGPGLEETIRRGNVIITGTHLDNQGVDAVLNHVNQDEPIYISFDADALDPSIAPGVGIPEPGGLSYNLAKDLLCKLAQKAKVVGIDFTEYNPKLDHNEITGVTLVNLIMEFLSTQFKKNELMVC